MAEPVENGKQNIYDLSKDALTGLITGWGYPRYRADQLWTWLYRNKATSFDEMHTLPRDLRARLEAELRLGSLEVVREVRSSDGETKKFALRLADGQVIETVLMRYEGVRRTACISSQAGCAMGCVFCATGQMGFARHLSAGEIVEQALTVARDLEAQGERLSNVVMMGMGEPFHNYDNVLEAVRRLMDEDGLNIGQRHITVSTVGLVPAIRRFADEGLQVRLAISLHAATDEERSALLPVNRRYPIKDLIDAVQYYIERTNRRVTFEWTLIAYQNDTPEEAHKLGRLLQGMLVHVNVIPLNPTEGYSGAPSDPARVQQFVRIVEGYGVPTTVRIRRGIDVNAGCGQLSTAIQRGR
ncbi:MAG TPA: 23S rRNA (adenine(2503)-C(2))-methyltransferase RlmN [Aggregatilineales bacterium]|nr:23S rRNA (adenine(2503)-C(2))-methyltransferase RlmN [Aggregatilineales bacterium]HQA69613.1 23S rRNA (adenine(2503)-C(2))-methyltransferase RlmN [Aggregatilineales bacterium]